MNLENLKRLALLKNLKARHERMAVIIGAEIEKLSEAGYIEMMDANIPNINIDGFADNRVRIFTPDLMPRVTVRDEQAYHQWLEGNNFGSLIKPAVHHASTEKLVKHLLLQNLPLPAMLSVWEQKKIRITLKPERKKA